ncbi:MAG: hypothetical protein OMM_03009 [Candidatus Magnetoglobus multicellularis str. Araruama]|uniref:Magnetosome protein Mad25 n=1 Tax=Candidatus Magnetoglobus multicellularis str. Araruama TaxID=890399 RepID=A0A1V1P7J8_9BACT|nr:MAG: hypothetical protein OMM_03009 [Candidatus Magnetoglobus multicellularis str. Araruama]
MEDTMTQTDTKTQDAQIEDFTQDQTSEMAPMDALANEIAQSTEDQALDISLQDSDIALPQIKGLEELKEGIYAVDLDSTIDNMYNVITNMETQLKNVLKINAKLEKELARSKVRIEHLKDQETFLNEKIEQLENEMPSKRELTIELEHLVSERNDDQVTIRAMNKRIAQMNEDIQKYKDRLDLASEEKNDLIADVEFMDATIGDSVKTIHDYQLNIKYLKGQAIANANTIKELESQLSQSASEKIQLQQKLSESRKTISELHGAWQHYREKKASMVN